jgi:hypothetical protein
MKLNKQTLKRIIKEELDAVMNETMTAPPIGGSITPEQQQKIDGLIRSGNPEDMNFAKSLVDALGGNPEYIETKNLLTPTLVLIIRTETEEVV